MGFREVTDVFEGVMTVSPAQKLILVALADRADRNGEAWPSVDELCRRSLQGKRTVIRHLGVMKDAGIISVRARRVQREDGTWIQKSNLYRLNLEAIRAGEYLGESGKSEPECQTGTPVSVGQENSRSEPECQTGTPVSVGQENSRSEPECQIGTPDKPECQIEHDRGANGGTRTNHQINYHPSPLPPTAESAPGLGAVVETGEGGVPDGPPGSGQLSRDDGPAAATPAAAPAPEPVPEGDYNPTETLLVATLARRVLPPAMQAMPFLELVDVGRAIKTRCEAGWAPEQVSAMLASRCLPDNVRHLKALVMARLRDDVPPDAPPTPVGEPGVWSHRLADGRVVTRRDIDAGRLARDFRAAQAAGDVAASGDRWAFAVAVGVEKYLL